MATYSRAGLGSWNQGETSSNLSRVYPGGWEQLTAASAGGSLIKSINGLAIGSVKSINGLAIASVKSINGLSNV